MKVITKTKKNIFVRPILKYQPNLLFNFKKSNGHRRKLYALKATKLMGHGKIIYYMEKLVSNTRVESILKENMWMDQEFRGNYGL